MKLWLRKVSKEKASHEITALEFFASHEQSEILHLAVWFHELIESGQVGRFDYKAEQKKAASA